MQGSESGFQVGFSDAVTQDNKDKYWHLGSLLPCLILLFHMLSFALHHVIISGHSSMWRKFLVEVVPLTALDQHCYFYS